MFEFPKKYLQDQYLIPLKLVFVYVTWRIFHHLTNIKATPLFYFWKQFCLMLGSWYAGAVSFLLSFFGIASSSNLNKIFLSENFREIRVTEHCLGIPAMLFFTASILVFKGSLKDKIWFVTLGLIGIIFINYIRMFFLCFACLYLTQQFYDLHHSVIWVVITYSFIFMMIVWWINRSVKQSIVNKLVD
jgi:exosortase/archaeosortase family protein